MGRVLCSQLRYMAELSLRASRARREAMGSSLLHQPTPQEIQDGIAAGLFTIDDDHQGFFAKGRDFESVGTAHT